MFKKKCKACGEKIEKKFKYCPYCGASIKEEENKRRYGFLGINDDISPDLKLPFGFQGIFSKLIRELDKQIKSLVDEDIKERSFKRGIKINISSLNGKPIVKLNEMGEKIPIRKVAKQILDKEKLKKFIQLPKKEAETNVRRLSNKIVYEIYLPGVNSLKDIIINKLENSIEIKALSKDKVYFKTIPNLPLIKYGLKKEKLILELKPKS